MLFLQLFLTVFVVPKTQDKARSFLRSSNVNFFDNFVKQQKLNNTIIFDTPKAITIMQKNIFNLLRQHEINLSNYQLMTSKISNQSNIKPINSMEFIFCISFNLITAIKTQTKTVNKRTRKDDKSNPYRINSKELALYLFWSTVNKTKK